MSKIDYEYEDHKVYTIINGQRLVSIELYSLNDAEILIIINQMASFNENNDNITQEQRIQKLDNIRLMLSDFIN